MDGINNRGPNGHVLALFVWLNTASKEQPSMYNRYSNPCFFTFAFILPKLISCDF